MLSHESVFGENEFKVAIYLRPITVAQTMLTDIAFDGLVIQLVKI